MELVSLCVSHSWRSVGEFSSTRNPVTEGNWRQRYGYLGSSPEVSWNDFHTYLGPHTAINY